MIWLFWLIVEGPPKALDWYDDATPGKIDHGKAFGDIVVFTLLITVVRVALVTKQFPPAVLVIALIAGALGSRVFLAFLHRDKDEVTPT